MRPPHTEPAVQDSDETELSVTVKCEGKSYEELCEPIEEGAPDIEERSEEQNGVLPFLRSRLRYCVDCIILCSEWKHRSLASKAFYVCLLGCSFIFASPTGEVSVHRHGVHWRGAMGKRDRSGTGRGPHVNGPYYWDLPDDPQGDRSCLGKTR